MTLDFSSSFSRQDAKDHASEERSQATTKQHHQLFQQVMEEECMEDRVIKESNQHHLHQSHQHNHHATRIEYCASNGVMDKWVTVMSAHPDYLVPYLRTHNYLLKGDGPLPFSYRHYIAIMVSLISSPRDIRYTIGGGCKNIKLR